MQGLYETVKALADVVIPHEYGIDPRGKLSIGCVRISNLDVLLFTRGRGYGMAVLPPCAWPGPPRQAVRRVRLNFESSERCGCILIWQGAMVLGDSGMIGTSGKKLFWCQAGRRVPPHV